MRLWDKFFTRKKVKSPFFLSLEQILHFKPKDPLLYQLAFRHSSSSAFKSEKNHPHNNQRLEFLGDAILGAVVSSFLYDRYPDKDEGFLTHMRSKIVSRSNLNNVAKHLGIDELVICKLYRKKLAKSIGGDTLEALIGAIYLDKGEKVAQNFIVQNILHSGVLNVRELEEHVISYKSQIIEWAQKQKALFRFELLDQWGKQHSMNFKVGFYLNEELLETGTGTSKKLAEEEASRRAFEKLLLKNG